MNECKWYYYIPGMSWDGFFGPYRSKEEAIEGARKYNIKNFYITYGLDCVDFFTE